MYRYQLWGMGLMFDYVTKLRSVFPEGFTVIMYEKYYSSLSKLATTRILWKLS